MRKEGFASTQKNIVFKESSINGEFGFRIDKNGRPEGTLETDKGVLHYTCNSPKEEILNEKGILPLGRFFNIGANEVLLIPYKYFEEKGIRVGTIEAENLLRDFSRTDL